LLEKKSKASNMCSESLKKIASQMLLARTCNPSYSGGGDQEDSGSKPAQAHTSRGTNLKEHFTKKEADRVAQGEALNSKPNTAKKRKL
jgi:hypothetical protein